jgi:hypothetical protein
MAAEIVQGLFGVSPQSMKAQQDAQNYAQQMQLASLSPEQQRFVMMGQGGRAAGQALGGLFGAQDPMITANNQSNDLVGQVLSGLTPEQQQDPMAVHTAIYNAAMQAGDMELANRSYGQIQQARATSLSQEKDRAGINKDIALTAKAEADAKKSLAEKLPAFAQLLEANNIKQGTPAFKQAMDEFITKEKSTPPQTADNDSDRAKRAKFIEDFGPVKGEDLYQEFKQGQKIAQGKSTVAIPEGGSSIKDASQAGLVLDRMNKSTSEALTDINQSLTLGRLSKGNPSALTQLNKALARLNNSGNLSKKELDAAANAGNFSQSFVNRFANIFNGTDIKATYDDKIAVLEAIQNSLIARNNSNIDNFTELAKSSGIGSTTIEALTKNGRYNPNRPKKTLTREEFRVQQGNK